MWGPDAVFHRVWMMNLPFPIPVGSCRDANLSESLIKNMPFSSVWSCRDINFIESGGEYAVSQCGVRMLI
jgi:hypothetical protein